MGTNQDRCSNHYSEEKQVNTPDTNETPDELPEPPAIALICRIKITKVDDDQPAGPDPDTDDKENPT